MNTSKKWRSSEQIGTLELSTAPFVYQLCGVLLQAERNKKQQM